MKIGVHFLLQATITDSNGAIRLLPFWQANGSLYDFAMFVPETAQFTLNVSSNYISLADQSGSALASNTYQATLTTPTVASIQASAPAGLPFWLAGRTGFPSKIVGFQVNGLLAQ